MNFLTCRFPGISALLCLCVLLSGFSCKAQEQPPTPEELSKVKVEAITAAAAEKMLQDAKGKVVVVNLWATWCPPCRAELPDLNAFYKETDREKLVFLSFSVDDPEEMEKTVKPFAAKQKLAFPVYILKDPDLEDLSKKLGVTLEGAIPTTIVYSREGKPAKPWVGSISKEELQDLVKSYL